MSERRYLFLVYLLKIPCPINPIWIYLTSSNNYFIHLMTLIWFKKYQITIYIINIHILDISIKVLKKFLKNNPYFFMSPCHHNITCYFTKIVMEFLKRSLCFLMSCLIISLLVTNLFWTILIELLRKFFQDEFIFLNDLTNDEVITGSLFL